MHLKYDIGTRYSNSVIYDEATGLKVDGFQVFQQHHKDGTPTGRTSFVNPLTGNLCSVAISHKVRRDCREAELDRALSLVGMVARLNPDAGEIGAGMLANLVQVARAIHANATGEQL